MISSIIVRQLNLCDWQSVSHAMHTYTNQRNHESNDEIWLVEHPSIFTQGKLGIKKHILNPNKIQVIQSDRGGQITYHGPGQQIMYVLIDLKRCKVSVHKLINILEYSVINTLSYFEINSHNQLNAPGVYVQNKKICSLGLRISRGCSLHGLALNVTVDLDPFLDINPCGFANMKMTNMQHYNPKIDIKKVRVVLVSEFIKLMNYQYVLWTS
ncbi:octanoyltransferase [Candidatus Pantoea edessiphila]|uniref:Octanoyltransferase n=1 Tax=Candidatus Pantoea edessiphila TaxID=2044610 RepID=A0A2P5SZ60_9GAMM|nr:lipoyl(octanoyl) transferase LipB [Pantoea sp. Edef]PPI87615.1 octanoyltransferase [Candidatus Pantoea edessiphila]